jgi:FkbM family methyltransferase
MPSIVCDLSVLRVEAIGIIATDCTLRSQNEGSHIRRLLALVAVIVTALSAYAALQRSRAAELFLENRRCCQLTFTRDLHVTLAELRGRQEYFGEIGQDKWVLEKVFPGLNDGYFVDIGSGHGTIGSNSRTLEQRGWTGICIDPFPVHMEGRTCKMFTEVVFSKPGLLMTFHTAGGLGGVEDTLGQWNKTAAGAPTVSVTTVTLDDILARAKAPQFINYVSLDIEGAELEALRGFPFDRYRVGAWTIEHNREEPKRSQIVALLAEHGYRRVNEWRQDDFFVPVDARY